MRFDIEDYVTANLVGVKESASGSDGQEYTAACPECEKSSKFYVNVTTGRFVCFACEFRGRNIIGLISAIERISYSEARAYVFKNSVELRRAESTTTLAEKIAAIRPHAVVEEEGDDFQDFGLPERFRPVWSKKRGWNYPLYFKERKIKGETAKAWGLGWCKSGFYASRMVIPFECPNGRSWTARDMGTGQEPKYLNPKGADHRKLLIGWNMSPLVGDIVLVEGPLDAVRLWQHSIPALAVGGKELHEEQRDLLMTLDPDQAIIIMLDPEEELAPEKVAPKLASHFKNLYVAKLPDGEDPGSATPRQVHAAIDGARKWTGDRSGKLAAMLKASRKSIENRH